MNPKQLFAFVTLFNLLSACGGVAEDSGPGAGESTGPQPDAGESEDEDDGELLPPVDPEPTEPEEERQDDGDDDDDDDDVEVIVEPGSIGHEQQSCGAFWFQSDRDPVPVDCSRYGDVESFCVYSNHCFCSAQFQCEVPGPPEWGGSECAEGASCVPIE